MLPYVGLNVVSSIGVSRESFLLNDTSSHHANPVMTAGSATHHANMMLHPAMHASMHHHANLAAAHTHNFQINIL